MQSPCILFLIQLLHLIDGLPREGDLKANEIDNDNWFPLTNEFYREPNEEIGRNVESSNVNSGVQPEESRNYIDGDIEMLPRIARNGLRDENSKWKDGIIPYEISDSFTSSDVDKIKKTMAYFQVYTCIRFVPRKSSNRDYIYLTNKYSGCYSQLGRGTGRHVINLQSSGCMENGTIVHELMHVCGFNHEQNRPDRDDYVTILWHNIEPESQGNFTKVSWDNFTDFGVPYDYTSVMHYGENAFSKNERPTIVAKKPVPGGKMSQRDGFSRGDLLKLNSMYKCRNVIPPPAPIPSVDE